MAASMRIDQAGLPAGIADRGRTDGLLTGALVTLTSLGSGTTHTFRLLWRPPEDTTAVSTLAQTGPTTWTFTPTANAVGSYRAELIVDEGLATEDRQIHTLVMRTSTGSLIIPALNEVADPTASLVNAGATQIDAAEQNEAFSPFLGGSYAGWWRAFDGMARAVGVAQQQVPGAINEDETIVGAERVIGGLIYNGGFAILPIRFRFIGVLVGAGGDAQVRLYDMGPAAGPPGAPALRSTATILLADAGFVVKKDVTLSPVAAPAAPNEIFNTSRLYEVRLFLSVGATSMKVHWAGIAAGSSI